VITFRLDGEAVSVAGDEVSLLDVLREEFGCLAVKDGCSPQGQCGCCTVLVDGKARVACVTPARRVEGRDVVTVAGLPDDVRRRWADAFFAAGASQCGFCTPGIILRLVDLSNRRVTPTAHDVKTALLAHLCRCTGWQTIVEATCRVLGVSAETFEEPAERATAGPRDPLLVAWRAELEGRTAQVGGPEIALGGAGFADDVAPRRALVAVPAAAPRYEVSAQLHEARRGAGRVPGRNSTVGITHPLDPPAGDWMLTLCTTWVEPAYLELDASWCEPGGTPASPVANGGAFGGKGRSPVTADAARLANDHWQAVRVVWPREHVARWGPKRPPMAMAIRADGSGVVRVASTPGSRADDLTRVAQRIALVAPALEVELVPVAGPPVSGDLRGAGWAEATAFLVGWRARRDGQLGPGTPVEVTAPDGGRARVCIGDDGVVHVEVWAGEVLDPVTLRSYCIGAVHQALGWVWSEAVAVGADGEVLDLTIRSYRILSARDMPSVAVTLHCGDGWPVNGSDAVFAATAGAAWIAGGLMPRWPTGGQPPRASRDATPGTQPT
jgi:aerobic-type carbon monoxide dehydrogenase small subunit (CoxS/CutS family)